MKNPITDLLRPVRYTVPTYETSILAGLQGKHVYGGTVDPAVVAQRRARNKVARRSRRINRAGR